MSLRPVRRADGFGVVVRNTNLHHADGSIAPDWKTDLPERFATFAQAAYWRNAEIVKRVDYVAAFWDGESKGTMHTIDLATAAGKLIDPTRLGPFPWEIAEEPDRGAAVTRPAR